jgi:hypothetical protein
MPLLRIEAGKSNPFSLGDGVKSCSSFARRLDCRQGDRLDQGMPSKHIGEAAFVLLL